MSEKKEIDFSGIEKKWHKKWEDAGTFEVKEDSKKKKFYALEMYPYPSGSGLHMGHAFNYTICDVLARFKVMQGFNVLHPTGYDSFGLPAENAAIKAKTHPKKYTDEAIKNYIRQQKALGFSYDWSRKLQSHDSEYYKWNQYFFLQFLKNGLAYRKRSNVNWCIKCNSVLANEQVHNGKCWRHSDTEIEIKSLEQWFLETTKYAEELLSKIDDLDWPERIKIMQKNWIGKSEGSEIIFKINGKDWKIFTTRADTLMGITFLVISAQHPELMEIVSKEKKKDVENFVKKIRTTKQEDIDKLDKEGVFTGSYAIHPLTGEKIPVWAGNFVLADYGSGMVMAVPAHDQRDFEFAKKYGIPVKVVVQSEDTKIITIDDSLKPEFYKKIDKFGKIEKKEGLVYIYTERVDEVLELAKNNFIGGPWYIHSEGKVEKILIYSTKDYRVFDWSDSKEKDSAKKFALKVGIKKEQLDFDELREAYTSYGILVNSGEFNGLTSDEAKEHITIFLKEKKLGGKVVNYKLRDWLISRQRYWGTPIPVVYCDDCGIVPVDEKDLPILLPEKVKFGEGNPLTTSKEFVETKCPKCGEKGRRETDTMDTFFDSSWYYLRFCDAMNKEMPFDKKKVEYWMPVDFYTGGAEHANMHLIYARFFTKTLRDLGFLKFDEPFKRLFNQGMIHGEDGFVMSKSRGNVIDPLDISNKYGVDTLRVFLVSMSSPDRDSVWSNTGIDGSYKLITKIVNFMENVKVGKSNTRTEHKVNLTIKKVTEEIENLKYNYAIIKIRELLDSIEEISKKDLQNIIKIIAPFAPHIAEELWEKHGGKGFVSLADWPVWDEKKIDNKIEEMEKNVDKTVADVLNVLRIVKEKQGKEGEKVYLYVIPNEIDNYNTEMLEKRTNKKVKVFAVNDKKKYDPEGKAGKAKPGKPAIFIE